MSAPRPDASVIIPVLDGADWIAEQLRALAAQDFTGRWDVVVCDNGSTDQTPSVVEAMAADFPVPLRLLDASQRRSIGHARNLGVLSTEAPVVAFCDSDDHAAPEWLSGAVSGLGDLDLVSGCTRLLTEALDPHSERLNLELDLTRAVTSCNFAARRAAYLSVGGFDEGLPPYGCEEFELAIRASDAGLRMGGSESMVMYFRRTVGVRATMRKVFRSGTAEAVVWQRHPRRFAAHSRPGRLARELLRLPVQWLRPARNGGSIGARAALRRAVTIAGNIRGLIALRRGEFTRPELIEVDETPPG